MSYFDNTHDASFYPTSDVSEESGFYPFVEQMPATEEVGTVDWSSMVGQPESVIYSPTDLWTTANYWGECRFKVFVGRCLTCEPPDPVASAASYTTWDYSDGQPEHPGYYWPTAGQQVQHYHPGFSSWDASPASLAVPETLAVAPTPSSGECRSCFEPPGT